MTWVTKIKKLSEEQLEIIPENLTLDRGVNRLEHGGGLFALLEGQPMDVHRRLSGLLTKTAVQKRHKKSVLKLLAEAKDADTVFVYCYQKEC